MSIYITKLNENVTQMAKSDKAILAITRDELPQNPRTEWDNLGKMICFHRKYTLGDKHNYDMEDYAGWDELESAIYKDEDVAICLPLFLYDHSGITISTGDSYPDKRWDAGQVGFIIATKPAIRECYNIKGVTKKDIKKAKEVLLGEIKTYDQYLRGDVYGFILETPDGEHLDSCSGFYGDDFEENGMADELGNEYEDLLKALEYV